MKNSVRVTLVMTLAMICLSVLTAQIPAPKSAKVATVPSFVVKLPTSIPKGLEFLVDVRLNDPDSTMNLFGLSLDFIYTHTQVVDLVGFDTSGTLFGGDILYFSIGDDKNGKASLGLSKKKPAAGISGSGSLAKIRLKTTMSAAAGTMLTFSLSNLKALDSAGVPITYTKAPDSLAVIKGNIVWPGDTDSSGVVTQADLLPIGLNWLRTGTKRTGGSTTWTAQPATPWTPASAVYADANGDGTVNQADVLVIGLNWQKVATAGSWSIRTVDPQFSMEGTAGTPLLRPVPPGSIARGGEFNVDVVIGDQSNPVSSLFGISYVLDFSAAKDVLQVVDVVPGTFLGNDVIFFPQTDNTGGTVSFGISRKAGQVGVSGSGAVARVIFRLLGPVAAAEFRTRDIVANNQYGYAIQINPAVSSTAVSVEAAASIPTRTGLMQNYPNPFNPSTVLRYQVSLQSDVSLKVIDVLGREVATLASGTLPPGEYSIQWDASRLPSGMYIGVLRAGPVTQTTRMLLMK